MQKETEIKLRVSRETLAALREHPLLKKRNKSGWERRELMNQYFDTPERDLAQAKVALRLRKDGDDIIQTLKTRGQSVAGLSERNEYNWDLPKAKLDVKKLDGECWPEQLAELDKKTLKPIFTTDFVRERAEIAWGRGKAKVVIEAALDLGHVVVGKQKEEICELELELREGEPAALLELAAELAATLALMPCDISKAERGYRLYDASSYSLSLPAPQIHAEMPLDDAFAAIMWHLLGSSQRLAEQYRFNGHWRLLQDWVENLGELRALIGSLGQAAPRQSTSELRSALDALLEDWRPLVQAGDDDEDIRKAAPEQFVEELQDVRWGLFSLNTSRWLLARTWTEARNVRGNRQGAAQITNWLPRLLADDAVALQLPRYQQQPEDLAEQLPRIERIQAWLHHARHVVDTPELDRLYGELNKLAHLANQPITDESLDARMHQAIAVYQNRAWKTLLRL
ncbi:inorganic triphosphatase [Pseudomonas sp. Wu6]|uniref:CYTH domain-containing protein n=1 Tax=Pseudomonas sp. Wu6 TaxID=1210129 RepID=UPI001CA6A591|nr:CYTH domain-containing protein [Pseudomonas sp. Wu6]MBY8929185.1 inorganic triphosphatase [Pseudomonas sp. Wu6]